MSKVYIPTQWDYDVSISFDDISEYLSDTDYKKYKDKFLSVNVTLIYDNTLSDPDVGIESSFDFVDCIPKNTYPQEILDAVDKRLKEYEEWYADKAYEKLCDFVDYQKYGDY